MALALAGATLWRLLRHRVAWQRHLAVAAAALAVVAGVLLWLRIEQQWVAPHHSVAALLLGAWARARLFKRAASTRWTR